MTQQTNSHLLAESISALADNQASELELQRILKASESDPEVNATWFRYQVTSAAMRGDLPILELSDFAARVSAAIDQEETYIAEPESATNAKKPVGWWQNLGRFAVAASVAGGVVLFAQNFNGISETAPVVASTSEAQVQPAAAVQAPSIPAGYHAQPLMARAVGLQSGYEPRQSESRQVVFIPRQNGSQVTSQVSGEEVRDYLNQLIEDHADNAALNSGQGMLPFARVVLTEED